MSVHTPEQSLRVKERLKSRITFLSDSDGKLLDSLGVRHQAGRNDGADIAFPTAVLVDGDGLVRWIFQSGSFQERARADEIFAAIEVLPDRS